MLEDIEVLCHSSIKLNTEKIIYFDPFRINENYHDADIIFITHDHYDHYSEEDIDKVVKEGTKNSKFASLDYEVLKYNEDIELSLLKIDLHTGRHHQIRVQLSSRNHSIYGDQKYGGRGHGKQIALWAYKLKILHPITKEEMVFKSIPEPIGSWKILEEIEL